MDNKLICPVKRLNNNTNKTTVDVKIDLQNDDINVKLYITTKNVIKSLIDFINKKFNK